MSRRLPQLSFRDDVVLRAEGELRDVLGAVLADHDGPVGRLDLLAVGAGGMLVRRGRRVTTLGRPSER